MSWRKWNNIIHRDLGYLCVGLSIIYGISGVVLNHRRDWNSNYKIETISTTVAPVTENSDDVNAVAAEMLSRLDIQGAYKNAYSPKPDTITIFLEGNTVTANYRTGVVQQEIVRSRPFLRQFNFLHLNEAKRFWTYFADVYALSLIILAITGMFVLKGKNGIKRRGGWLVVGGILIPILSLAWFYF